jgi:hypothetical protein
MPVCPNCGGADATELAPGYWRCDSYRDEDFCGHHYQVGGAALTSAQPLCECGTFAVGKCAECGKWVCGSHSGIPYWEGRRLCDQHRAESESAHYARQRVVSEERKAEIEAAAREHQAEYEARELRAKREKQRNEAAAAIGVAVAGVTLYGFLRAEGWSTPLSLVTTGAVLGFVLGFVSSARSENGYDGVIAGMAAVWWALVGAAVGGVLALAV